MEDGSELLRHSQGLSIEEEWNKIDGPPIRQVTAIVIGLGNVSIFCDINGVIWCNYYLTIDWTYIMLLFILLDISEAKDMLLIQ